MASQEKDIEKAAEQNLPSYQDVMDSDLPSYEELFGVKTFKKPTVCYNF